MGGARFHLLTACMIAASAGAAPADDATDFFEAKVRPLLIDRCQRCHGAEAQKGSLRLDARAGWERGGDQGPAVVPGKPEESLLVAAVGYEDEALRMPPGGKLPDAEVATLVEWVRRGAPDPRTGTAGHLGGMTLEEARDWWSLQPVRRPAVPACGDGGPANTIDAFVRDRLAAAGLTPAPPADRRTLIRRVAYDLTGLPPTPDEVAAFEADTRPDAYERLVDRLLASPAHGERWGRHWLDLARYADTAGENSDHPVPHAWRYRNWVIDALNADLPYDEFVRAQVAGDILAAGRPDAERPALLAATGFLAVARRFGHDIDKDMYLTYDDVIDTTGKALLGLSLGCARCHAHKYDPVSAEDYYALYGILESTRFSFPGCEPNQRPRDLVPLVSETERERVERPHRERLAALDAELKALDDAQAALTRRAEAAGGSRRVLAEGTIADGGAHDLAAPGGATLGPVEVSPGQALLLAVSPDGDYGADSTGVAWTVAAADGRRWDLAADAVRDALAHNPVPGPDGGTPAWALLDLRGGLRLLGESARDLNCAPGLNAWRAAGDTPSAFVNAADAEARVWTPLPGRSFFVHPAPDGPVGVAWISPMAGAVTIAGRIADAHPGGPNGVGWRLELVAADLGAALREAGALAERRTRLMRTRAEVEARIPAPALAYAVQEGTPHDARMLLRGDPEKPGPVVPRRWLEVLGGQPVPADGGSGRRTLAAWLTDPANPLVARVFVNRLWLHHFGRGLVATPSDFGARGEPPSHPELLDWLAAELIEGGWSVKRLHRLIVLSEAYRRASANLDPALRAADPDNTWLARFERRRLDAEELRDTLRRLAGTLDRAPGGPHPFPREESWGYTQHAPFAESYDTDKRGVYVMQRRNRRDPYFNLFDGADPNATTPTRPATTVPPQALFFLNDPEFHDQARRLADRVLAEPDDAARFDRLVRLIFQRDPTAAERDLAARFRARYAASLTGMSGAEATREAWAALARVLLSSNEFLHVD